MAAFQAARVSPDLRPAIAAGVELARDLLGSFAARRRWPWATYLSGTLGIQKGDRVWALFHAQTARNIWKIPARGFCGMGCSCRADSYTAAPTRKRPGFIDDARQAFVVNPNRPTVFPAGTELANTCT